MYSLSAAMGGLSENPALPFAEENMACTAPGCSRKPYCRGAFVFPDGIVFCIATEMPV